MGRKNLVVLHKLILKLLSHYFEIHLLENDYTNLFEIHIIAKKFSSSTYLPIHDELKFSLSGFHCVLMPFSLYFFTIENHLQY